MITLREGTAPLAAARNANWRKQVAAGGVGFWSPNCGRNGEVTVGFCSFGRIRLD
jgi:hypothetical protein